MRRLVAIAGMLFALSLPALAQDGALSIGSFKDAKTDAWRFRLGSEFPGAQGCFAVIKEPGAPSGWAAFLEGDFRVGGYYVSMALGQLPCEIPFKGIRLLVKTEAYDALIVRLVDASGQTHQSQVELKKTQEWQLVELKSFKGDSYIHWNGVKDGAWHDPIKGVALIADCKCLRAGRGEGSLLIAAIELER